MPLAGLCERLGIAAVFEYLEMQPAITRLGFEPRLSEPKSLVLPLHHQVMFLFYTGDMAQFQVRIFGLVFGSPERTEKANCSS